MPTGPVTHGKAWIEMIHRYLATGVGVLILTLAAGTWVLRRRGAAVSPWWPTATLAWVCLQGAFGAWTVTMKLFPAMVTLHLLAGIVLLALLCRQAVAYAHAPARAAPAAIAPSTRGWLLAALCARVAAGRAGRLGQHQLRGARLHRLSRPARAVGGRPMDFRQGFELWRDLGKTGAGEHIGFAALTAIHYVHRLFAYGVFAVLALVGLAAASRRRVAIRRPGGLRRWSLWQLATGMANVLLGWPLLVAVAHTGGAAALVVVLTWALCRKPRRGQPGGRCAGRCTGAVGMSTVEPQAVLQPVASRLRQFYALTKPRVIQLIVFCALIGMVLAVPGMPSLADLRLGARRLRWASGWWRPPPRSSIAWSKKASMRR